MQIPESFYESEIREGFYVPAKMKRGWASMLIVLDEIDKVCKRHNITWWMDWGSMLATVRHGGFIPWDDDIDISMMRADYERFLEVAPKELPEGYEIVNLRNNIDDPDYISRVVNSFEVTENKGFLSKNAGFPYVMGIDVMVIDYVSREMDEAFHDIVMPLNTIAFQTDCQAVFDDLTEYHELFLAVEKSAKIHFDRKKPIAQQLRLYCEEVMASVKREDATAAAMMGAHITRPDFIAVFPVEYYEKMIELPYEFMMVPVPLHYDEMLKKIFGNYMTPVRGGGTHEYPVYCHQEGWCQDIYGRIPYPYYTFDKSDIRETA